MKVNNLYNLLIVFEENADSELAKPMENYLRNKFSFLGIPAPKRKQLWNDVFKEVKKTKVIDWNFVNECWSSKYREHHYLAAYYLKNMVKFLNLEDIDKIKRLVITNSWWDTVDTLDKLVGDILYRNPGNDYIMLEWSLAENIWLRRVAIDHQLLRKEKTNSELLGAIIKNNLGSNEFFINKAIGWSLRDYSKTNPEWVKYFLEKYDKQLSNLSKREASKYII